MRCQLNDTPERELNPPEGHVPTFEEWRRDNWVHVRSAYLRDVGTISKMLASPRLAQDIAIAVHDYMPEVHETGRLTEWPAIEELGARIETAIYSYLNERALEQYDREVRDM